MSAATVDEIVDRASSLSDSEKATIASRLIRSLPAPDGGVSDEEVNERFRQMESGEVEGITFDLLVAGLDFGRS